MIPRVIHYCWFGENAVPNLALKCIDSWRKYFPGWEIRLWNEGNSPMESPYMQTAYANKKWSNMTNFIRLHALKNYGGIYLDTDVEIIRSFSFLQTYSCFVGFENSKTGEEMSINNAVIGSAANHPFVALSYDRLLTGFDGKEESYLSGPGLTTTLLKEKGLTDNREQNIDDVHIFSRETFHPFDWDDVFTYNCIKPTTYAVHYWSLSWKDAAAELKNLYAEKQKLVSELKQAKDCIAAFREGKIKRKDLVKTNLNFLKNSLKK